MPESRSERPTILAVWLVIAGVIGWWAAFSLTMERLHLLAEPDATAACDFSLLVQCTANLESAQGSVFGFPNPILGLTGWAAPVVVGLAILAGARFARWFWWCFWAGTVFAFGFVLWLIGQSVFALGTLCPWCMVTWAVTIPTFYAVTVQTLRVSGVRWAHRLAVWVPLAAIVTYVVIAVIAQLNLNWLAQL
ncbi:vitamin K epoxide reductase family protein [Microbacterium sp. Sa4CUA7]|uniref:Vitamin K epoxide reductase family protein n=1 Tax=Microbacterium pullorum TaxID=2762236 RepID=A0ABR8RZ70_9MICO|nr:vitamin K epoxide reductase family protein [Microbacterium pullorum]MBD7956533.1 vitamin K epoxide reductase family protein [Microbacterium pullorum]